MSSPFGAPAAQDSGAEVFTTDLTDVQSNFVIKAGSYPAKVVGVEKKNSKAGNPMYVFDFVIMSGEYAGKEFKSFCSLSIAALFKLAEVLEAIGLGAKGSVIQWSRNDAINRALMIHIDDGTFNDEVRSEIKKHTPHPDGPLVYENAPGLAATDGLPF